MQTAVLVAVFVAMAIPLGLSLARIAREAVIVSKVRSMLSERFGSRSRVTQLDMDFDASPIAVRSVVIAPRTSSTDTAKLKAAIEAGLSRPISLQLDQVLIGPGATALDAQRAEVDRARIATEGDRQEQGYAALVALAAGVPQDKVTVDHDHRRLTANAGALPGASLGSYRVLESRIGAMADGWQVAIIPPLQPLPDIAFADNKDTLDDAGRQAVLLSAWAARRWNAAALGVPGLPDGDAPEHPTLAQRRAAAIAAILKEQGVATRALPAAGQRFNLTPPPVTP